MTQRLLLGAWGFAAALPVTAFLALLFFHEGTDPPLKYFIWLLAPALGAGAFTMLLLSILQPKARGIRITPKFGALIALGAFLGVVSLIDGGLAIQAGSPARIGEFFSLAVRVAWYPLAIGAISGLAFQSISKHDA
ncbi:MAG: hypothetical protein IPP44_00360 [Ideonella sp.]|nr:hypothetical protein [Ideonella sp.]MBL0085163.1 hypothetical protein [Ideonella sp.]